MMRPGEENAQAGIARAARTAEHNHPGWIEEALEHLIKFDLDIFQTDDLRAWAYKQGFEPPPSERAWGAVMRRAASDGIIENVGMQRKKNPAANRTPAVVWKRTQKGLDMKKPPEPVQLNLF